MNPKIYSALALVLWTAWSSVACSGELQAKTFGKKTYEGSRDRAYQVYIPDTVTTSDPVPMVMVLHGCKRTERNMIDETGFKELADREKFVVVYPFITDWDRVQENRAENCWGFWFHATLVSVRRSRITLTGLSLVSSFAVPSQAAN